MRRYVVLRRLERAQRRRVRRLLVLSGGVALVFYAEVGLAVTSGRWALTAGLSNPAANWIQYGAWLAALSLTVLAARALRRLAEDWGARGQATWPYRVTGIVYALLGLVLVACTIPGCLHGLRG